MMNLSSIVLCLFLLGILTHTMESRLIPSGWWPTASRAMTRDPFFDPYYFGVNPYRPRHHVFEPYHSLSPFFDPWSHEPSDWLARMSYDWNKLKEVFSAQKNGEALSDDGGARHSFCEYHIEKTPQYDVTEIGGDTLSLMIDLPHVEKGSIRLIHDSEKKTLSLSAPFEIYQGFHDATEDVNDSENVHLEKNEPGSPKEATGGLVVTDDEEEEEKKRAEIQEGDSVSGAVQREKSSIRCKVNGLFKAIYSLPKGTKMEGITAKFVDQKLVVTVPVSKETASARTIQIE